MKDQQPCGACDIGIYNELAILNKKARAFSNLTKKERLANMPKCKNRDCNCIGAEDLHNLIESVDAYLEDVGGVV